MEKGLIPDAWERTFDALPDLIMILDRSHRIVDKGMAGALTTTTAKSDVYAFFFSQKGVMAGLGLQGSKISKIAK